MARYNPQLADFTQNMPRQGYSPTKFFIPTLRHSEHTMSSDGTIDLEDDTDLGWLKEYWHYIALLLSMVLAFYVRARTANSYVSQAQVALGSSDAWYQLRSVQYTIHNWPATINKDYFVAYPAGIETHLFGTFYDQIIATIALIVGLGDPSQQLVAKILLYAPPVAAVLTIGIAYLLGKELKGKIAGVLAAASLAVFPGAFYTESIVGLSDYHIVIAPFLLAAIYLTTRAIRQVREEGLNVTDISKENTSLLYAVEAGIMLGALSISVGESVYFVFAVLSYFAVDALRIDALGGDSSNRLKLGAVIAGLTTVITLPAVNDFSGFSLLGFSLLQVYVPAFATVLFGGGYLVRKSDTTGLIEDQFDTSLPKLRKFMPIVWMALVGTALLGVTTLVFSSAATALSGLAYILFPSSQIFGQVPNNLYSNYGLVSIVAIVGILFGVYETLTEDKSEILLLSISTLVVGVVIGTNQASYYYIAPLIAVLGAYMIYTLMEFSDITQNLPHIEAYQLLVLLLIVLLFIPSIAYPVSQSIATSQDQGPTTYARWQSSVNWLNENTEQSSIPEYGPYRDDYTPPKDASAIATYPGYNNFIAADGHRPTTGDTLSSQILLAQSEQRLQSILKQNDASVRYIAIDGNMIRPEGRLPSIIRQHPTAQAPQFYMPLYQTNSSSSTPQYLGSVRKDAYYQSMMVRLYYYNGRAVQPQPIVTQWQTQQVRGQQIAVTQGSPLRRFQSVGAAQAYIQNKTNAQLGGVRSASSTSLEAVDRLRLVHTGGPAVGNRPYNKVFEYVDGAQIQGQAPANTTVGLRVRMKSAQNRNFTYTKRVQTGPDGQFTTTFPYSTVNQPANYTVKTVSQVRAVAYARENNTIAVYGTQFEVPESAVVGDNREPIQITLKKQGELGGNSGNSASTPNNSSSNQTSDSQKSLHTPSELSQPIHHETPSQAWSTVRESDSWSARASPSSRNSKVAVNN